MAKAIANKPVVIDRDKFWIGLESYLYDAKNASAAVSDIAEDYLKPTTTPEILPLLVNDPDTKIIVLTDRQLAVLRHLIFQAEDYTSAAEAYWCSENEAPVDGRKQRARQCSAASATK